MVWGSDLDIIWIAGRERKAKRMPDSLSIVRAAVVDKGPSL